MKDKVLNFIVDELLNGNKISGQDDLLISGLVDSIGVMRLVAFIEEQTGKTVPPEDVTIEHFANLDAIGDYLEKISDWS